MSHNLQKKPSKGILKSSRSMDSTDGHASTSKRPKEQRFDETNILETFHPANKDYGHMKIDEPKTPYSEPMAGEPETEELDANVLAAKLAASMNEPPKCLVEEEDEPEDEETRRKRIEFEKKRKSHYNEFQALKLARQMMAQEEDEEDEDVGQEPQKSPRSSST